MCYMQLGVCVSFWVIYVYIEDIYHITVFRSGEPEAACHAFSTMLCILVGMPVISHLIPSLQLLHLNSASIVVPSYSLSITLYRNSYY